jgi:hypothetical protein
MGGPINGSKIGIVIPTVLQIASDALSYWTSMTCLYNKYWYAEQDVVTLPIAFFHVNKISEVHNSEVSKKRVILYEPAEKLVAADMSNMLRESVVQTIVDNVVKQPKSYTLDILVPAQPISRYIVAGLKEMQDIIVGMSEIFGGGDVNSTMKTALSAVFVALKAITVASDADKHLPDTQGISYVNKNSLSAMWESNKILTMKMWSGYDYKYVVITSLTIDKNPGEEDYFRGALQVQEIPVLCITPPPDMALSSVKRAWAAKALSPLRLSVWTQTALVQPLITMMRVKEASNQDFSLYDDMQDATGGSM